MSRFHTEGGGEDGKEAEHNLDVKAVCGSPKQKFRSALIRASKIKHHYFTESITVSVMV